MSHLVYGLFATFISALYLVLGVGIIIGIIGAFEGSFAYGAGAFACSVLLFALVSFHDGDDEED